jgi:hypothetical protein
LPCPVFHWPGLLINIARSLMHKPNTIVFLSHVLLEQRFHLEGNFLPKGNFGLWKEIWKEIAFGRKYCYKEGNEKEILFYLIISKNKAIFIQFCAKENSENAISNDLETPHFQNFPKRDLTDVGNYNQFQKSWDRCQPQNL